jgi:hypothetical protein
MSTGTPYRTLVFRIGLALLATQAIFYAVWQRVGQHLNPCHGKAIGVEIGLLTAVATILMLLFGSGWQRGISIIAALMFLYLWFSWIAWIAQMQC